MAATPRFKVYTPAGEYVAACKEVEAAAALMGFYGEAATIRVGHTQRDIVWTEGPDGLAGESFDAVAEHVDRQLAARGRS